MEYLHGVIICAMYDLVFIDKHQVNTDVPSSLFGKFTGKFSVLNTLNQSCD